MNKRILIDTKEYQFELNSGEIALLNEFLGIIKSIQELSVIKSFSTSYTISGKINEPICVELKLPADEELSIILHKIRPLILQDERTYFIKILGLLSRKVDDAGFRSYLKSLKQKFLIHQSQQAVFISINDTDISNEKILFEWLNAYEYHRDIHKIAMLQPLIESFGVELFRATMIEKLIDKFNAVQELAHIVEHFMDTSGKQVMIQTNTIPVIEENL